MRVALLYTSATATRIMAPTKVGNNKKFQAGSVKKTTTGFEPAGGCTVRVSIIMAIAVPTASATAHHWGPNAARKTRPTSELIK